MADLNKIVDELSSLSVMASKTLGASSNQNKQCAWIVSLFCHS